LSGERIADDLDSALSQDLLKVARAREGILETGRQEQNQDARGLLADPEERVWDPAGKEDERAGLGSEPPISADEVHGAGEDVEALVLVPVDVQRRAVARRDLSLDQPQHSAGVAATSQHALATSRNEERLGQVSAHDGPSASRVDRSRRMVARVSLSSSAPTGAPIRSAQGRWESAICRMAQCPASVQASSFARR
jgi:hypothetical protein